MYNPCFECLNRYGKPYSKDCDDTCEYAHAVKEIGCELNELKLRIETIESKLERMRYATKDELDELGVWVNELKTLSDKLSWLKE